MSASLRDALGRARDAFVRAGIPLNEASLDAEVLARHVLGWDRAQLLTNWHAAPPQTFESAFASLVARRRAREPVALIVGHREFWGREFSVSRAVLIPRPETELIVEQVLLRHPPERPGRIVDVGTGSGCIAVALACELPSVHILAIDCSAAALAIASRNVAHHGMTGRVLLVRGNFLDAVHGPADVIVSNPPYVPRRDAPGLQPEVARFEPAVALFADDEGLAALRVLCETAAPKLAPGGFLVVEFGAGQQTALRKMAEAEGWTVDFTADLAGIPRVAVMAR